MKLPIPAGVIPHNGFIFSSAFLPPRVRGGSGARSATKGEPFNETNNSLPSAAAARGQVLLVRVSISMTHRDDGIADHASFYSDPVPSPLVVSSYLLHCTGSPSKVDRRIAASPTGQRFRTCETSLPGTSVGDSSRKHHRSVPILSLPKMRGALSLLTPLYR